MKEIAVMTLKFGPLRNLHLDLGPLFQSPEYLACPKYSLALLAEG